MQKTASRDARAAVIVQVFFDYARGWTGSDAALTDFEIIRHHIVNTVTIHISLDIAVFVDNRVSKTIALRLSFLIISLNICESGVVVLEVVFYVSVVVVTLIGVFTC